MWGYVAKAQRGEGGEGKINTVHERAGKIPVKVAPTFRVVHKIISKGKYPHFNCVGEQGKKNAQHDTKAMLHMHEWHVGGEPVQKLVM